MLRRTLPGPRQAPQSWQSTGLAYTAKMPNMLASMRVSEVDGMSDYICGSWLIFTTANLYNSQ